MVEAPDPGAGIGFGLKLTVTPLGCPGADNVTALLNPPETVVEMVEVPELPCATLTEVGVAEMAKLGGTTTVSVTVVVCVRPPPVPVTVIG
jgi:hypothetical protein